MMSFPSHSQPNSAFSVKPGPPTPPMLRRRRRLAAAAAALAVLILAAAAAGQEDDNRCLQEFKSSVTDPSGSLRTWTFANTSAGSLCKYDGVSCWNEQQSRILTLDLSSFSLAAPSIPGALRFCSAATTLDLSGNSFGGSIPSELCDWMPYLVTLDLSDNQLSGAIPMEMANCRFLNSLNLGGNQLNGAIPDSLSQLGRLKTLRLSGNKLSGQIPSSIGANFGRSSFDGNSGLCGKPLSPCGGKKPVIAIVVVAGLLGAVASLLVVFLLWRFAGKRRREKMPELGNAGGIGAPAAGNGSWWAERLRAAHNRLVPVSLFQKPIVKVKLADLMVATRDFSQSSVVVAGSARTGTAYRAVLRDGSALTVKRLHSCMLSEKAFRAEMGRIGQLRHPNLVPLLGYCIVEEERLLVYKHMPNGALSTLLKTLDWPTRLRIAVGAARGLAWLHHGFQVPFIHQNLSSSAVLLDEDDEARITDVGLTRLVRLSPGEGGDTSPFLNGDFGEFGYIAPEYASNPVATIKGDVFAFGVLLLELVSGQEASGVSGDAVAEGFRGTLVDWVQQLVAAGQTSDVIDGSLLGSGHDGEVEEFLKIACGCTASRPKSRFSMYRAYHSLKKIGGASYESSEQFDEFPLVYNWDETDAAQQ